MTLIVSLRTIDGIVLAGDSLATMMSQMNYQAEVEVRTEDGEIQTVPVNIPLPPMPSTTFSYAQKVFPFLRRYGIGIFGAGMLLGKSIYYIVREYEQILSDPQNLQRLNGVKDIANELGNHMFDKFKDQVKSEGHDINIFPENSSILGFQVVGYENGEAKTMEVHLGRKITINEITDPVGCTISGQKDVSLAIWSLYSNQYQSPAFDVFSLQDAIEYAEFLIDTTAKHQQFSRVMPTVGGEVDIALV